MSKRIDSCFAQAKKLGNLGGRKRRPLRCLIGAVNPFHSGYPPLQRGQAAAAAPPLANGQTTGGRARAPLSLREAGQVLA